MIIFNVFIENCMYYLWVTVYVCGWGNKILKTLCLLGSFWESQKSQDVEHCLSNFSMNQKFLMACENRSLGFSPECLSK